MSDTTIKVEALCVHAGTKKLLGPISFNLPTGRTLVIMGETGAGKSLLAQAILGTLPNGLSSSGIIYLKGQRIDQLSSEERSQFWGREVAILPQEPWRALDPLMRAAKQVNEAHRLVAGLRLKAAYTRQLLDSDPKAWPKQVPNQRGQRLLSAEGLSVYRGNKCLLKHFNLELHARERIAITGPSGVGKTSLLDVLAGIRNPEQGNIKRSNTVTQTGIQKLYQDPPAAFPNKVPLLKSLRDVARLHGIDWSVVSGYLSQLGIDESLLQRCPDAVSGGELQRISLARALTPKPSILLADEPTSRLDPITQHETLTMIADIANERGIAVILVTHDLDIATKWADRQYRLEASQQPVD